MPKQNIDYSKGLIYKIVCNDLTIKDCYVGSTTNFSKRKNEHKSYCTNVNGPQYVYKVYNFIRNNHGWQNWSMVLVENFPCTNGNELRARERYYFENLRATLNVQTPMQSNSESCAQYRIANRQEINNKQKKRYICLCGGKFTLVHKQNHYNTKKHQSFKARHQINGPDDHAPIMGSLS